jgi:hypothetical protein
VPYFSFSRPTFSFEKEKVGKKKTLTRGFYEPLFALIKRYYSFSKEKTGRTAAALPTTVFIWVFFI